MKKIKLETYGRKVYSNFFAKSWNCTKKILYNINILLVYLFKYILGIFVILFLMSILILTVLNWDMTKCSYHSKLISIEGKCSQIFFTLNLDGKMLTLIGADYDYNSWGTILDWNREVIDQSQKIGLSKEEIINNTEKWNEFTDQLNDAHNIIYR